MEAKSDKDRGCSRLGRPREERGKNHTHAGTIWNTPQLEHTQVKNIKEAGEVGGQRAIHRKGSREAKKDF